MPTVTRYPLILLILAALATLSSCGGEDDIVDPPGPTFAVTVEVADAAGAPVPGLAMSLAPDGPWYGEKAHGVALPAAAIERLRLPHPCPFNPAVTLDFELDGARDVTLTVEDVATGTVKLLVDEPLIAGAHSVAWNGLDDDGERVPSGIYRARLELRDQDTGDVVLDQSQTMLLAILDPDRYSVGTTDADGRIVLEDIRLFPYLFDVPDFPAVDETGEQIGTISLTAAMRFYLRDPATGDLMQFHADVNGSETLQFTWDPAP